MTRPVGENARRIAQRIVDDFERSGYGTPKPDRWTPTWPSLDVKVLAEAYLEQFGSKAATGEGA